MSELRKEISFLGLIAIGAAGIIGSSWIYTNSAFWKEFGAGGEIFGFLLTVALLVPVALAYAELASTIPRAGGEICYAYLGINRTMAFWSGWFLIGCYVIGSCSFYVATLGWLLAWMFPQLQVIPLYTIVGHTVYLPYLVLGIIGALIYFALNYRSVKISAWAQTAMFIFLITLGAILAVVGFTRGSPDNFWPPFWPDKNPLACVLGFAIPAFTYLSGFEVVAMMAEEAKMPPRRIGLSSVLSLVIAGLFYATVLTAAAWLLPWEYTATALDRGTIEEFAVAGFPALGAAAWCISMLGLLTSWLALFMAASRVVLALARAGLLPEAFRKIHPKYGTPTNALLLVLAISLAIGWLGRAAIIWLLDVAGVLMALAWMIGTISLVMLRRKFPHVERPFKVPAYRVICCISVIFLSVMVVLALIPGTPISLVWPYEYGILGLWILLGVIFYVLTPRRLSDAEALRLLLGKELYSKFFKET